MVNNRLRGTLGTARGALKLSSTDRPARLAAVKTLEDGAGEEMLPLIAKALAAEADPQIKRSLALVHASVQLKSADAGARDAVLTSAYALDDAQLNALISELEPHFGSKLQVRVEVDAALIGGVKVVVGDQVLDASVRGKLEAMAAALKN